MVVLGFSVYNYSMNSSLKALIEPLDRTTKGEVVGLMMSTGGRATVVIKVSPTTSMVPRSVYATKEAFDDDRTRIVSENIEHRVDELARMVASKAWQHKQLTPL